jgi:TetR/AcrR family transcriptional regulator, mexJK operon transcriptional repressor
MVSESNPHDASRAGPLARKSRASGPGRPKDLGKRAAILDAAKRLFVAHGYEGASMDQIAADAGVSKLTVYSHFGDKDSLFTAAIVAKLDEQVPAALFQSTAGEGEENGTLRAQLVRIGLAFFSLVSSEEALSMHRMMMTATGEAHVRQLFWEAGPQRLKADFGDFLCQAISKRQLNCLDTERAASQFFCLLKGDLHMRLMCCLCEPPAAAEVRAHVDATVDMFLRAYGVADSGRDDLG